MSLLGRLTGTGPREVTLRRPGLDAAAARALVEPRLVTWMTSGEWTAGTGEVRAFVPAGPVVPEDVRITLTDADDGVDVLVVSRPAGELAWRVAIGSVLMVLGLAAAAWALAHGDLATGALSLGLVVVVRIGTALRRASAEVNIADLLKPLNAA